MAWVAVGAVRMERSGHILDGNFKDKSWQFGCGMRENKYKAKI